MDYQKKKNRVTMGSVMHSMVAKHRLGFQCLAAGAITVVWSGAEGSNTFPGYMAMSLTPGSSVKNTNLLASSGTEG